METIQILWLLLLIVITSRFINKPTTNILKMLVPGILVILVSFQLTNNMETSIYILIALIAIRMTRVNLTNEGLDLIIF